MLLLPRGGRGKKHQIQFFVKAFPQTSMFAPKLSTRSFSKLVRRLQRADLTPNTGQEGESEEMLLLGLRNKVVKEEAALYRDKDH